MKDPIERREALDEWKNDFKGYINALNMPRDDYNGIIEYINELPSPYNSSYAKVIDKLLAVASAKTETHDKRTETNARDCISKSMVCEIMADIYPTDGEKIVAVKDIDKAYEKILQLPPVQSTVCQQNHGETVSKQAAIDAVNKNRDSVFHDSVHYEDAVYDISNLPPVQSEPDWDYSEETKQITLIVPEDVYKSAETIFLSVGNEGTFGIRGMVYSAQPSSSCSHENDTISRRAAISLPVKPKEDRYFQTQNLDDAYDYGWYDLQECIEKLPPAQSERKVSSRKGHWVKHDTGHSIYYDCSLCGCAAPCTETADKFLWKLSNYCPDCGSEMCNAGGWKDG